MKKNILVLAIVVSIAACNSKKSSTAASTAPASAPTAVATVPANPNDVNETLLSLAKTKFADASIEKLNTGHDLYFGTCTRCHGAKSISRFTTDRWPGIIEDMARKARINDAEKQAVLQYVTAVSLNK